jgi:hypothetical protein
VLAVLVQTRDSMIADVALADMGESVGVEWLSPLESVGLIAAIAKPCSPAVATANHRTFITLDIISIATIR